ncbi:zinc-finger protein (macronuclear) [Tetrahymena thermophila SB210]|uniref:Zinc-finger protein n=1 Tax=Tetrahymena thermophila (strain SB210) TaxID=312017 RepID=I7MK02_TETTS|nr:zinc-finger protein [Tetrahymena thermophila SB210]7TGH_S6 Chain S6, Zinc-finger protein [Tetrahymena thermophila]8B6F_BR Chain BR, Zinc-finger protein [Tetrahymena thermophila SB210]8BQS_BR Chain BR, Zinc-finger protein [Tetrahymena thermophila SB210]8GYM_S6 Chain S6, Zinc-finger protein [Tetrahymena thermophila SB210]8GYM_s6 Chain s6, Zinc-finger protein [Tetrahymena thermophila SB210]8GZU_S6 Chain S6, Zinc-finger protein [Tetrahymena thermophila SB210]8GZU_s6 Chain s6, Zinc-finger prot|eukprot:XP_001027945.1 zinc-finger protein [Tetrahymena thermophila SB210]
MIAQGLKRLSLLKNLKKSAQLYYFNKQAFGSDVDKNLNPYSYEALKENHWLVSDSSKKNSEWTHKSNAEQLIAKVPIIYVDSNIVRCIGGTEINAGHPQVYIQLDTRKHGTPQTCKYCGLRYAKKMDGHHHH